jgi:uncharacterized protein (TIGR00290 family)
MTTHHPIQRKKTLLSWSSGKDSAWSLWQLRQNPQIEVVGLFTTLNQQNERVNMHGTLLAVLKRQAAAAQMPLRQIYLPDPCSFEIYNTIMRNFVEDCRREGIACMAFGDLYLEDIRSYREKQLNGTGIEPVFPLWGTPTKQLAAQMLDGGLDARISCIDLRKLPASFAGRRWNKDLLSELPPGCDPCGENGEFHTVTTGGPMFLTPIAVRVGEKVERDGFLYTDIIPATESQQ